MKVHHLLFIAWLIVFAFWLARQFSRSNRKHEQQKRRM
jgi:positive regulator of sigma E activity